VDFFSFEFWVGVAELRPSLSSSICGLDNVAAHNMNDFTDDLYESMDETVMDSVDSMDNAVEKDLGNMDDLAGTVHPDLDRKGRLISAAAVVDYHNLVLHDSFNASRLLQQLSFIPHIFKQPYHTCPFKGIDWVDDLLHPDSHPERIRAALGVHSHVFYALLKVLRKLGFSDSRHVLLREQLAIFLHGCVKGLSVVDLGERFQRSPDTITK